MNGCLKKQYSDMRECLTDILRNRGKSFFKNGNQMVALLRDLMPTNKGEINMIRQMAENGILSDFVSVDAKGQSDKERAVYSAVQTLVDVMFIDEDKARQYVTMLTEVFGWKVSLQPERETNSRNNRKLDTPAYGLRKEADNKTEEAMRKALVETVRKGAERKAKEETDRKAQEEGTHRAQYPQIQRKFLQSKQDFLKIMVTAILEYGGIETAFLQAKEAQPVVEKLIDLGKKGDIEAYRRVLSFITKENVSRKLFKEIAPKYSRRNGSYTRITRIGPRRGDPNEMAVIELI